MGSEGRREQIVPTDQDNALIVRDGIDVDAVMPACRAITDALIGLGYPRCSGDIMVSNPYWVLTQSQFRSRVSHWIVSSGNDDVMNLAIFFDADAVAGDERLLDGVKAALFEVVATSDAFLFEIRQCHQRVSRADRHFLPTATRSYRGPGRDAGYQEGRRVSDRAWNSQPGPAEKADDDADARAHRGFGRECVLSTSASRGKSPRPSASCARCGPNPASLRSSPVGVATNRIRPDELTHIDQEVLTESLRVVIRLRKLVGQHFRLELLGF